jgi:hypothetical protein
VRLSEEELALAEQGDQLAIKKVVASYRAMLKSPLYDAVLTRLIVFDTWDSEIREKKPDILGNEESNDKAIERVRKYLIDQPSLVEATEKMQEKLSGEQKEQIQRDKRVKKGEDRAFERVMQI